MNNRFDQAASAWDQDAQKVRMAETIADVMIKHLHFAPGQVLIDYGTGTGLIALKLQPYVGKLIAADTSQGMLDILNEKLAQRGITNVELLNTTVENVAIHVKAADIIAGSMVLHHIQDTSAVARLFWSVLKPGGQIALADLDEENNEFHSEANAAVHHGFNRIELQKIFNNAGFETIQFHTAYTVTKPVRNGQERPFTIFLMTAIKPSA